MILLSKLTRILLNLFVALTENKGGRVKVSKKIVITLSLDPATIQSLDRVSGQTGLSRSLTADLAINKGLSRIAGMFRKHETPANTNQTDNHTVGEAAS